MTIPQGGWHLDPRTLREVVDDRPALEAVLGVASPTDRVWLLRVLGRVEAAVAEGDFLLAGSPDWRDVLVVAHAHHWRGNFARAAELQSRALAIAGSPERLATTRQHIGKRLFDEGRIGEALLEFEAALALRTLLGSELVESSRKAARRARQLLGAEQ
jgi:tetratricopeptide (TPR) repeat protein